jgi:WhiB family transcriptional regulator, redox-sensing transcriptional regulator
MGDPMFHQQPIMNQQVLISQQPTWRIRGACQGLDPAIFFPDSEEDADEAVSICNECGVRIACLEHALASREKDGVWGGATEKERRRIIRQRRRSA